MKRHDSKLLPKLLPALVGCALALGFDWAAAAGEAARATGLAASADGRVPQFIAQSPVNNPAADATAQDTQIDTTVVDLGGGNLVAAYTDTGSRLASALHFTGYAWSNTNGASWTDAGALPGSTGGDNGHPVLAAHTASASVYLATPGNIYDNIQVFKSTDAGHIFGAPVIATPGATPGNRLDRPWIAVDNFPGAGNGTVYVCWTRNGSNFTAADIRLTRSIDGGATFGPSIGVPVSVGGTGCSIAISPNHQVNVFYYRGTGLHGQGGDNKIFTRRSNNLGVNFSPEVQVADLNTTTIAGDLGLLGGVRTNSLPQAVVNPVAARPFIYVTYNDLDITTPANKAEAYYVVSTDGGRTWSAPAKVNNDPAGDQYRPTAAIIAAGDRILFGYYSRSHDPANLVFHRRARYGEINAVSGLVTPFRASFQLGADTPIVFGQDPAVSSPYMGDYDTIAGGTGSFTSVWSDNRRSNAFHAYQPDVYSAVIAVPIAAGDLGVTIAASPASIALGQNTTITVTASAVSGTANDVVLSIPAIPNGLVPLSVTSTGGQCTIAAGFVTCSMGSIAAGTSKSVQITAVAVLAAAVRTVRAIGTTSSADTSAANNAATANVTVTPGTAVVTTHSTGNIAVPIRDLTTVDVPLTIPAGGPIIGDLTVRVRLNHTYDSDLVISIIAPTGQIIPLASRRGSFGADFGTGLNDCSGAPTAFSDIYTAPISGGVAPFSGNFKPEQPLLPTFAGLPSQGVWKLRVADIVGRDSGTVGCVSVSLWRAP